MIYLKKFTEHVKYESKFNGLQRDLLTHFGYYATNDETKRKIALNVYMEYMKDPFENTKVNHMDQYYFEPDRSPRLVFHTSNQDFDRFKTPAFFEPTGVAYQGDITYACVINLENPLNLESRYYTDLYGKEQGIQKWYDILQDILGDEYSEKKEFIEEYKDNYGFFKIIQNETFNYDWQKVFNYIKTKGYDGAIYKESDQSIRNFFTAYCVMDADNIKILDKAVNQD